MRVKKVSELIAELQQIASRGDLPVMMDGYEMGYDYPASVQVKRVRHSDWMAEFAISGDYADALDDNDPRPSFLVAYISRSE